MTAVVVCVSLLVVLASAVVFLSCAEKSREIDVVTRNRPLHPAERGPGAYLLPPPDVPFDVLPPSAAIVPPPTEEWCDCPICAKARARLRALFNDTNPKGDET